MLADASYSMVMSEEKTPETDASTSEEQSGLDDAMVQLLVCPLTKQPLTYDKQADEFISKAAQLAYPVRGGVPILLPSEARSLDMPTGASAQQDE